MIALHYRYNLAATLTLLFTTVTSSAESCVPNVRLVNGRSERSGRVELCWSNQWKAVCDDGWGIEEAITVCRELGYLNSNGLAIAVTGSHFGGAQEIHQLKQWNCQSDDTTIAHCSKATAHQNCSGSETAGVYCQGSDNCQDGDIRLMNGSFLSTYEGRVEICFNGVWGTICSDGWDYRDATVVCRELGIAEQAIGIAVPFSELYGEGEGPVMLERVNCNKRHMQRLSECERSDPRPGIISHHCTHSMDAGVICRVVYEPVVHEHAGDITTSPQSSISTSTTNYVTSSTPSPQILDSNNLLQAHNLLLIALSVTSIAVIVVVITSGICVTVQLAPLFFKQRQKKKQLEPTFQSKQQIECAPGPQYAEIDDIICTRRNIETDQNVAYGKVELAHVTVHCSQNEAYGTVENTV